MLQCIAVRCFHSIATPRSRSIQSISSRVVTQRWLSSKGENEKSSSTPQATENPLAEYLNESNQRDQVFSAISDDGSVKVTACTARNLINDLMIMHTMTAIPADALGRTVICALLMSNGMQAEQTCQITINSDGPLRGVVAISNGMGKVRGYVGSPMLGETQLTEAIGKGLVQVVKNHPDWPNPYNGITSIRHGDIDRDVGIYLAESEQRSCALAAATSINSILCTAAGGYLIEQLPDASPETLSRVEKNLAVLVERDGGDTLPTNLLSNGVTPLEIAETILDGLGMKPLQQIEPQFECQCSSQRLVRALRLLPREEVDQILESQQKIEARCDFCGKQYKMGPDEIRKELDNATGDPALDGDLKEEK
ncbi:Hsp33 domain containing protein [Nitzschia inconspicua]|uniref:Hsp33 domain containing protein n=1 Tax=Nitzschia inconspicua TaxID=303405 RepID=A0A9K3Q7F6_9STRA|nr:Hsp33 domain containing protein [Nitzschia inconspicua]